MALPLPQDIYPLLISHITSLPILSILSQVDHLFLTLTRNKLYERVWIRPWEQGTERKFKCLMRSLSESGESGTPFVREGNREGVASLVLELDVRFYPMAAGPALENTCVQALTKMINLENLGWTRDTTFTESMVLALTSPAPAQLQSPASPPLSDIDVGIPPSADSRTQSQPILVSVSDPQVHEDEPTRAQLRRLEINGHLAYSAKLLLRFEGLRELKVILPSRDLAKGVIGLCRSLWMQGEYEATITKDNDQTRPDVGAKTPTTGTAKTIKRSTTGLRSLEIVTANARHIDDAFLISLAAYLGNLETFKLTGAGHVRPAGFYAILRVAQDTLKELALETCWEVDEGDWWDRVTGPPIEPSVSKGIRLRKLDSLSVTDGTFRRFLQNDAVRKCLPEPTAAVGIPFFLQNRDRSEVISFLTWPVSDSSAHPKKSVGTLHTSPLDPADSFLPPTLRSLHIHHRMDSPDPTPVFVSCMLWPGLKKLWYTGAEVALREFTCVDLMPGLESFMVCSASDISEDVLKSELARMRNLRVLHLQVLDRGPHTRGFSHFTLTAFARSCADTLEQIGWANKVYAVWRRKIIVEPPKDAGAEWKSRGWMHVRKDGKDEDAEKIPIVKEREEVYLEDWNRPGIIPDAFQVWRA